MRTVPLLLSSLAFTAVAAAQAVVTPAGYATAEGNANNAFPWNRGTSSTRIQFVTDSSHFTGQGVTFPILIQQLRYRADAAAATTTWAGGSWPQVRIDMATCPVDFAAVSPTFASNLGPDLTTVHNGPVTVAGGSGNGTGIPGPWYITIPLSTPFLYDPSVGDLVVDIHQNGAGWSGTSRAADHVSSAGSPPPLGSRIYNTSATALTDPTGTVGVNYSPVTEFSYMPASGLHASFSANVTSGPTPLVVNFTDNSFSSAPGGVTSWAWDFDGDGTIDSTVQNPTFTYAGCGNFNVSLTVTDGQHAPSTLVRNAYIKTDEITASFTDTLIAAQLVLFTDTSTSPATAWAWDLDGDGITDSTAQNPAWLYPNTNPVNVTLTATRNCKQSTVTRTIVPAQVLTTNLAANNGGSSLWTVYFNVDVLNPLGVRITGFDSITSTTNTAFTVDVYLKLGGYSGFEYVPSAWTKVGAASGTSNPVANQPSYAAFAQPLYIPEGSYGIALRYIGVNPRYVTLTSIATVGNGDLSLTLGSAAATTTAPFQGTSTTVNTPRMWSGTIYYGTHNITGQAGFGWYGPGCASSLGVTHQTYVTPPTLGGTLTIQLDNMPYALGVIVVGLSRTTSAFGPLPFDLGIIGAPGCPLRVSPDATGTVLGSGTGAVWSFGIPVNPALQGALLYDQVAVFDPAANALGFAFSDAAAWLLGL